MATASRRLPEPGKYGVGTRAPPDGIPTSSNEKISFRSQETACSGSPFRAADMASIPKSQLIYHVLRHVNARRMSEAYPQQFEMFQCVQTFSIVAFAMETLRSGVSGSHPYSPTRAGWSFVYVGPSQNDVSMSS